MKARLLSRNTERKISDALSFALDRIVEGGPPESALEKAARASDLTADQIRMLCRAYNTGVVAYQINSGRDVFEKAASPYLVDPERIIARIFTEPARPQPKVAADYKLPPSALLRPPKRDSWFAKLALDTTDIRTTPNDNIREREQKKLAYESASYVKYASEKRYNDAVSQLREYFMSADAIAPDEVLENSRAVLGNACVPIIKKAAAGSSVNAQRFVRNKPVDWNSPPYSLVAQAVDNTTKYAIANAVSNKIDIYEKEKRLKKSAKLKEPVYGSVIDHLCRQSCITDALVKSAILENIEKTVSRGIGETVVGGGLPATLALASDPDLMLRTSKARVRGILAHLAANDPIISEHSDRDIATAYNHLSKIAPRAMQNPTIITAYLRKMLSSGGVLDPFDTEQLSRIEKQMGESASRLERRFGIKLDGKDSK